MDNDKKLNTLNNILSLERTGHIPITIWIQISFLKRTLEEHPYRVFYFDGKPSSESISNMLELLSITDRPNDILITFINRQIDDILLDKKYLSIYLEKLNNIIIDKKLDDYNIRDIGGLMPYNNDRKIDYFIYRLIISNAIDGEQKVGDYLYNLIDLI